MSILYTFATNGAPNFPYTAPLQIGASNATVRFMATRSGFNPQFLSRTYTYAPAIIVTPSGQFANATTFAINGGCDLKYSIADGPWQTYEGPFTLDGIADGSGTIQAYSTVGTETNVTAVSFKAAAPIVTPTGGQVSGTYTVSEIGHYQRQRLLCNRSPDRKRARPGRRHKSFHGGSQFGRIPLAHLRGSQG